MTCEGWDWAHCFQKKKNNMYSVDIFSKQKIHLQVDKPFIQWATMHNVNAFFTCALFACHPFYLFLLNHNHVRYMAKLWTQSNILYWMSIICVILTVLFTLVFFNRCLGKSVQDRADSLTVLMLSMNAKAPSVPAVKRCHAIDAERSVWTKWGKSVCVCV